MGNQLPQKATGRTLDFPDAGVGSIVTVNLTEKEQRVACCIFQIPSSGQDRRWAMDYGFATPAVGAILEVGGSAVAFGHVDGETVTISDGFNSVVFEYDEDGVVVPGNTPIPIYPTDTQEQVAIITRDTINSVPNAQLAITASILAANPRQVELANQVGGTFGNIAIVHTVASIQYGTGGMAGGLDIPDPSIAAVQGAVRLMGAGVWTFDYYGDQIRLRLITATVPADVLLCELFFSTNVRAQQQRIAFPTGA